MMDGSDPSDGLCDSLRPVVEWISAVRQAPTPTDALITIRREFQAAFSAADILVFSRDRPSLPAMSGDVDALQATPALAGLIEKGQVSVFQTDNPRYVRNPLGKGTAVVLPWAGEGSRRAFVLHWPGGERHFTPDELREMATWAIIAGTNLDLHFERRKSARAAAMQANESRNLFAVIRGIANRSAEGVDTVDDYLAHFVGRIDALSRSHYLSSEGVSFELLLLDELNAETILATDRVKMEGFDVEISFRQAEILGLALHELAVNSLKFGAIADPQGKLSIKWWVEAKSDAPYLTLVWSETFTPDPEHVPDHEGFGHSLIRDALPYQLRAETSLEIGNGGMECRIAFPMERNHDR